MTDWTDTAADDTTVSNASFETPIDSSWTVSQNKTYPNATWERLYTQLARTGDYVLRAKLQKAGANYRGSTWFYNINTYPTTASGHSYRVTVNARRWLNPAGSNWTLRVGVSSNGDLNESTDYANSTFGVDYQACTHDFTGDGEDYFTITVYCIADDANTVQYPVIVDDISLTNLTTSGSWSADSAGSGTWTAEAAGVGVWQDIVPYTTAWTEESPNTTTWTEE